MNAEPGAIILTFPTTHALLAAERELAEEGWAIEVIPLPVGIASDCGFCVRRIPGTRGPADRADREFLDIAAALRCDGIWTERTLADAETGREAHIYERR